MRIAVIDDDRLAAISLKTILESTGSVTVEAMGSSGTEAMGIYESVRPDVMLMDIRMEGMTGLEAGEILMKKHPEAKILYLTTFSDDEYIAKALFIGARGYILKQDFEGIAPALEAVMRGQTVFGSEVADRLPAVMKSREEFDFGKFGITDKEKEILTLVAEGLNNKEIAGKMYLSEGTVRNYLSALLEKLDLRDRTQLAVFYYKEIKGQ
ncbi:MAG: response regulator transcription factor [Ruminococcus sp.]|nr:response regulator transcription factor [Ruminococcus sp.]